MAPVIIATLLTCHNRKNCTLSALRSLYSQVVEDNVEFHVFLVDDGSSDGTVEAIRSMFPHVQIINGDGSLFWNGGMRLAYEEAIRNSNTFILWLNDDTLLDQNAIMLLLQTYLRVKDASGRESIVVGTTHGNGGYLCRPTYGGVIRPYKIRRLKFQLVYPSHEPVECDTMNGNCVLIPRKIAEAVGNLDAIFTHSMGDFDYGFRARKLGYAVYVAPGYVGLCDHNEISGTYQDPELPLLKRLKLVNSAKGRPFREWLVFSMRYGGVFWPYYIISPYVRIVSSFLARKIFRLSRA